MNSPRSRVSALPLALLALLALPVRGQGGSTTPPPLPDVVYANGKVNGGNLPLWVMSRDGSNARQVLGEDCKYAYPTLAPDGTQIAFTKTRSGVSAVWVVNHDGTGLHAATPIVQPIASQWASTFPSSRAVFSPTPAPDGQRKLIFADRPAPGTTQRQLFAVNLDGSGRTQLTSGTNLHLNGPAAWEWSADATRIAYLTESGPAVAMLSVVGGQLAITSQSLLAVSAPHSRIVEIGWANAVDTLVVTIQDSAWGLNRDLWLLDPAGVFLPVRVTNTSDDEMLPTFAANDTALVFGRAAGGTCVQVISSGARALANSKAQSPYHRRG